MIPGEHPEAFAETGVSTDADAAGEYDGIILSDYDLDVHRSNLAEYRDLHAERWANMVGPRHVNANTDTLGDRVARPVLAWVDQAWSGRPTGALVLFGPVGTGKTWAAVAVLRRWYEARQHVEYWQAAELFDALRPSAGDNPENVPPETVLDRVKRARLLVLDDLADERQTEWVRERLDVIVGYRHRLGLPIVITTNARPDVLAEHVGARIASRFREDGGRAIAMGGADRRG